jgi:hypothetical protein
MLLNINIKCKVTQTKYQVSATTKEEVIKLILEKFIANSYKKSRSSTGTNVSGKIDAYTSQNNL